MRTFKVAAIVATLLLGLSAQAVSATHWDDVDLVLKSESQQCVGGTKIDIPSDFVSGTVYALNGGGTVTLWIDDTANGEVLAWLIQGGFVASSVLVAGGPTHANLYTYVPADTGDNGLHAPTNPNNGKWYGVSNVCFLTAKKTTS